MATRSAIHCHTTLVRTLVTSQRTSRTPFRSYSGSHVRPGSPSRVQGPNHSRISSPDLRAKRPLFTSLPTTITADSSTAHEQISHRTNRLSAPLNQSFHTSKRQPFYTHTHNQNQTSDDSTLNPGSRAFGECEISALSDLFLQFAQESHSVDADGPFLDLDGIRRLLASIGERHLDESTLQKLFDDINVNRDGKLRLPCFLASSDRVLGDSPARIILVVGGPGSGKGAVCERLAADCGAVHISCGNLLRDEVKADTPMGREVAAIMEDGGLVSSAVVTALMRRKMRQFPGRRILLDGFPRSKENARDFVEQCGPPELALHLDCEDATLIERILKRGKDSAEQTDGGEGRTDDNIDTALKRLRNYHKYHRSTMEWLRKQHVPIVELDCSGTKENVWGQLMAIGRLMRPAVKIPPTPKSEPSANRSEDEEWFA